VGGGYIPPGYLPRPLDHAAEGPYPAPRDHHADQQFLGVTSSSRAGPRLQDDGVLGSVLPTHAGWWTFCHPGRLESV